MTVRKLNEQSFCGWCGSKVIYVQDWMSECTNCGYKRYINHNPCCNIIVNSGDAVLMVRRSIEPKLGKLDFPGGFMDMTDSSIEEASYRELLEELLINKDEISELIYLGSSTEPYLWQATELNSACFFFTCNLLIDKKDINLDLKENSELCWVTKEDFSDIDFAWNIDKEMLTKYFKEKI